MTTPYNPAIDINRLTMSPGGYSVVELRAFAPGLGLDPNQSKQELIRLIKGALGTAVRTPGVPIATPIVPSPRPITVGQVPYPGMAPTILPTRVPSPPVYTQEQPGGVFGFAQFHMNRQRQEETNRQHHREQIENLATLGRDELTYLLLRKIQEKNLTDLQLAELIDQIDKNKIRFEVVAQPRAVAPARVATPPRVPNPTGVPVTGRVGTDYENWPHNEVQTEYLRRGGRQILGIGPQAKETMISFLRRTDQGLPSY